MGLLDLLNNDTITLTGDPGNVVTFSAGLYGSLGSKGRSFNPTGEGEPGKNGPILGDRVTFSANANADPTFEYGEGYTRGSVIDNAVRGGAKFNLERRETDFKRLSRFVFETEQGKQFIAKETALQILNPTAPKIYNLGAGLLSNSDIVRGATNTMAQVLTAGISNIKRGGLLPNPGGELFPNQGNYYGGFKEAKQDRETKYGLGTSAVKSDLLDTLIGVSIDDIAGAFGGGKGYNVSLEDSVLKVDKLNMLSILDAEGGAAEVSDIYQGLEDFIPFRFEVLDHTNPFKSKIIAFRAFLDSFGDNYNANFNEIKYNGRPENLFSYESFSRSISVSFKIAAQTRHEMKPLYTRLNYLVSQTAPGFIGGRMTTPYIRLTVGDWCKRVPGVINSVELSWQTEYSWEIKSDAEGKDSDMLMLPHVLDVSVSFTPIHDFVPSNELDNAPFIAAQGDLINSASPSATGTGTGNTTADSVSTGENAVANNEE